PPAPRQPPAVAATADERGTPRTTPSALPGAPAAIRPAAASPRWAPARVLMPAYAQRPEELRSAPPCGRCSWDSPPPPVGACRVRRDDHVNGCCPGRASAALGTHALDACSVDVKGIRAVRSATLSLFRLRGQSGLRPWCAAHHRGARSGARSRFRLQNE